MRMMVSFFKKSLIVWYVSLSLCFVSMFPSQSQALFLPHPDAVSPSIPSGQRTHDLKKIQRLLENKIVRQRLLDFGLTEAEVASRLHHLSDQEIHQISAHLDSLIPGGDPGLGIVVGLLVVAILVVILLQLTGHRVIVTK